ncbi:replication initiation protein [Ideonella sp. 4Y16]|uniref:replication initiation protein n=1 Tax=Ideonella alba TaxID=2824118 RepID=UPI001B395C74|nr:replication initiation protein [Ideonella alba]MBQ0946382.1 replication initiation protein [Ideonella alba]
MSDLDEAVSGLATRVPGPAPGDDLRKPHEMIVMMPRSGRVTLTGRRLYNALLQVSQSHMAAMPAMPPADFMFSAPLPSLLRATGSSGEDRTAAKRYLREMRGLEVDWESTAAGDGVKWRGFSMLSEVSIEVRNGENWVSWSYPPTLMAALREPTRWARLDLEVLGRLGTYTALALYEICARYRDNPSGLTSRKPVAWWADALSNAPANGERREWRKFKSERVKDAIDEINRETEIEIELIEHKQGRAVEEVQFAVRKKRQAPRELPHVPIDVDLVRRASQLHIREIKLDGLILEFGDQAVRSCLDHIERRVANPALKPIDNAYSYLRTLLRNGGVEQAPDTPDTTPSAESDLSSPRSPAQKAAQQAAQSQAELEARQVKLGERIAQLRSEIQALDPLRRKAFVDKAITLMTERGLFTPVIRRRAEQGDPLHGPLGAMVVRCYAESTYGTNWEVLA